MKSEWRVSIPAIGGNSDRQQKSFAYFRINPRNGGAIAIWKAASGRGVISIPAMGGNSEKELAENLEGNINPRNGGQ